MYLSISTKSKRYKQLKSAPFLTCKICITNPPKAIAIITFELHSCYSQLTHQNPIKIVLALR
jgi:hypothetical protein